MTNGRQRTLAIDCGSTNLKAAVFDHALHRLAEISVRVEYRTGQPEIVEFDLEPYWNSAVRLIYDVCAKAGVATTDVTHLAVTSQAQTFTVIDGSSSRALMPFVSWIDKRPVAEAAELQKKLGDEFHQHTSFLTCIPQLQLAKLLWVKHQPGSQSSPIQRVVALPTLFMLRLAGLNVIDRNAAAMSGLYSLKTGTWWTQAVDACGWGVDQLSTLTDVGEAIPAVDQSPLKFSPELQVISAGNDQTSGAYGTGLRDDGVVLTLGTALVAYRHAGNARGPYHRAGIWGPYPGGGYYELATRDEGCAALDWAIEHLTPGSNPDAFRALGEPTVPGASRFYPRRKGSDAAWTGANDLASRARAVIEGISFSARQLIQQDLEAIGDSPVQVLGGGGQSRLWLQLLADILNRPVQRGSGDTLLGAAMMATPRNARPPDLVRSPVIVPDPERARLYETLFQRWLADLP